MCPRRYCGMLWTAQDLDEQLTVPWQLAKLSQSCVCSTSGGSAEQDLRHISVRAEGHLGAKACSSDAEQPEWHCLMRAPGTAMQSPTAVRGSTLTDATEMPAIFLCTQGTRRGCWKWTTPEATPVHARHCLLRQYDSACRKHALICHTTLHHACWVRPVHAERCACRVPPGGVGDRV